MNEALHSLLIWIHAHPQGALWLLFGIALLDSLFVIGAFVPAAPPLFAIGALVALGALELGPTITVAASGALLGDSLSFALGHHYGERLFTARVFVKHPEMVNRGRRFFARFGVYSVMLARFLGPMRAITPALAAAAGMRYWLFALADLVGAFAWASAFILPGVVFGASLGLAAEVAGRMASLMLGLLVLLWLVLWLMLLVSRLLQTYAPVWVHRLLDWSHRHRRIERYSLALLDEDLPETPALAVLASILLVAAATLLYLCAGSGVHDYPSTLDATVFQAMRDLHTPSGLALAHRVLQIGEWPVYVPVALLTLIGLLTLQTPRAAAHCLAALGFGAVIAAGLYAIPLLPPPAAYFTTPLAGSDRGRDFILATVTYSFLPVLLATGRSFAVRTLFYTVSVTTLLLLVLAQLYLGAQWASVAFLLLGFGLIWTALLGIGYRRHRPEQLPALRVLPVVILVSATAILLQWRQPAPSEAAPQAMHELSFAQWQAAAFRRLPAQRQDASGRARQAFSLQWAGSLADVDAQLRAAGWQTPPPLSLGQSLHWLTSSAAIAELPVLPQVHAGRYPALTLRLPINADQQYLLRLWPTRYQLDDGRPIWIGTIARQQARSFHRLLRYPVAVDAHPPLAPLLSSLPSTTHRSTAAIWLLWSDTPAPVP